MDISKLRQIKNESGMTNAEIAELSGIPFSTVNKIFSGATPNPRYGTLLAIEQVLTAKQKLPFVYDEDWQEPCLHGEAAPAYCYTARSYSHKDIDALSEGTHAELINGKLYLLATPTRIHQFLAGELLFAIKSHIRNNKGGCHVYTSPFAVRLFADDSTYVEPDVAVICNKDKLTEKGCNGAPDIAVEIVSPGNVNHDYVTKLAKYQQAGVREYWIINPETAKTLVMNFENPVNTGEYDFEETITSGVLEGIKICIKDLLVNF